MFDALAFSLSIAVAASHPEARDVTSPEAIVYSTAPAREQPLEAQNIVVKLNNVREAAGLPELQEDPALSAVALEHAQEMVQDEYFGHVAPSGETLETRMSQHGLRRILIGENLAWCSDVDEAAIDLWQSPEHQQNERDPRFRHVGVAALQTGSEGTLYVQLFTE